ncbi:MAG: MgtC/SapB family protein [Ketobacteraceae bacterium]|nr:MgtC/SapB family protein [Ketobacteraceae bacterium]
MSEFSTLYADYTTQIGILINAMVALVLGGIIGFERELKRRPAGMRTHFLVAVSAALFINLSELLVNISPGEAGSHLVNFDPSRALVAIVTGISFLGAGTIFRSEDGVTGLTTAATLLFAGAMGITVALGEYVLATALTLLIVALLRILGAVEDYINRQ